jgi:hypothetical protein
MMDDGVWSMMEYGCMSGQCMMEYEYISAHRTASGAGERVWVSAYKQFVVGERRQRFHPHHLRQHFLLPLLPPCPTPIALLLVL